MESYCSAGVKADCAAALTNKQYRDAGVLLEKAASQITTLFRFREGIINPPRDELPRVLVVTVRTIGRSDTPFSEDLAFRASAREEVPPVDPAHYLELETLLEFALQIGERLCSRSILCKNSLDAFIAGLRRLTAALLKQQRHLRETAPAPPPTRIEIRDYTGVRQKYSVGPQPGGAPQADQSGRKSLQAG